MTELTRYVILDTDMGLDDAWALVMLLTLGKLLKVKVLAITCSFGNTDLPNVTSNTFRVLDSMGMKIPVYNGRSKPILPDFLETGDLQGYYGVDGFGDIFPFINTTNLVKKDEASDAIYKLVKKYPKQISFISVGPLSNLAISLLAHENLVNQFKEIFIMGGNAYAYGNVRQGNTAEWNFHSDPEAAHIVLSEANCPVHILTWESCLEENFLITNDWQFNGPLSDIHSEVMDMLMSAEKKVAEINNSQTWGPADAILMACFLFEEKMILKQETHHAYVELSGKYTRGQVAIERVNSNLSKNVQLILQVNETAFTEYILQTAQATVGKVLGSSL
ncbi:hypothetical protein ACFFRR_001450 [Megaselia abdita]